MKILLLEDDQKIAAFLAKGLTQAGFTVDSVETGEDAYQLLHNPAGTEMIKYSIAIVDIMLPGIDGLSLIEKLRSEGINLPVLILSARNSVDQRIEGLRRGGDDYLTKPFSFAELLARIQALLRRTFQETQSGVLSFSDLTLDLFSRRVERAGTVIELQPKEFSLLEYFMRNKGMVLSKTMILNHIWDYNFDPQTNVVDVLVHRLRGKIDKGFKKEIIHTIRGVGYVLKEK